MSTGDPFYCLVHKSWHPCQECRALDEQIFGAASYQRIEAAVLAEARERVRALPSHTVTGYEWDCECGSSGVNCPHGLVDGEAVDRDDVLRVLGEPE